MKFSQNYGHLSAICFHCFTRFVKQLLADFLLLFLRCRRTLHKKRVFRAICTYCKRLCNDLVLSRLRQRVSRARILLRTLRRTHPSRRVRICFAKMHRTFLSPRLKKRDRPSYFAKNDVPMSFSAARSFVGTAFCRRRKTRLLFRVFYREIRIAIRARRLKRLFLPLFRALPRASFLSPSAGVFRKIRAVFAL